MDPRGRVQVIFHPQLPAKCVICGCHADGLRQFIDFGFQIEFYGSVVFCTECMTPVAEACEFIPYREFKKLANVLEISLDRGTELEAERDKLKSLLDGLLAYKPGSESVDPPVVVEESKEIGNGEGQVPEFTVESESESTESDSEPGQRDVPEITGDNKSQGRFEF